MAEYQVAAHAHTRETCSVTSPSQPRFSHATTTIATLEDVALRLFNLLHSPPLSLASLVRAGLLLEEEDVHGHFKLVSAAPVRSPAKATHISEQQLFFTSTGTTTSSSAAGGNENATDGQQSSLASLVSMSAPTTFGPTVGETKNSSADKGGHRNEHLSENLPPLSNEMYSTTEEDTTTAAPPVVAAATQAFAFPTTPVAAAAMATMRSCRPARVSGEALARRLADLYAHHPSYALREWLHREAVRLCCPSYQDPVSNDIIATAEALRQRDALVTLYVQLYEQFYVHGESPTTARGTHSPLKEPDPGVAAWSRSLHSLMGCHHLRERHCPHHSLEGFQRQSSGLASLSHAGIKNRVADTPPVEKPVGHGGVAAVCENPHGRLNKEVGSVALRFVQQLLCNTPKGLRNRMSSTRRSEVASAAKGISGTGVTITFVRPPEALHTRDNQTNTLGTSATKGVTDSTTVPTQLHTDKKQSELISENVEGLLRNQEPNARVSPVKHQDTPRCRPLLVVTSLDCMLGVEDSAVSAEEAAASKSNQVINASDRAAASTPGIPARRGPRICLHHFSATACRTETNEGGHVSEGDSGGADSAPVQRHGKQHRQRSRKHCRRYHHAESVSSSGSSSVSLPIAGEDGENELSLSESETDVDDEYDDDGELEEVGSTEESNNTHDHNSSANNTTTNGEENKKTDRHSGKEGKVGNGFVSRQSSSYQNAAATTTTMDFLASRNGGLLNTTVAAQLTASAASQVGLLTPQQQQLGKRGNAVANATLSRTTLEQQQQRCSATQISDFNGQTHSPNPLLGGYTLTRPFSIAELQQSEAQRLLHLPHYAQAHELNRLAGLRGRSCYQDPYTSCLVLTSLFLERLPHCYGEYCKHCPHGEICQRRHSCPRQHHHRHHHHHHESTWRVIKSSTAAVAKQSHMKGVDVLRWNRMDSDSDESVDSISTDVSSLDEDEDDMDDPGTIRFFEALGAADAAASAKNEKLPLPISKVASATATSKTNVGTLPPPFSSHTTPLSASASSSSPSDASSSSERGEDLDEQHRHHLLRSASLFTYEEGGESYAGNSAGVVVQVNSLRDLLSWGNNNDNSTSVLAAVTSTNGSDARLPEVLLAGDEAAVVNAMDVEELLRRHEASFEQFSYLDYSGL